MSDKSDIRGGLEEMDFYTTENVAGIDLPVSIPATYEFTSEPRFDAHAFQEEIEDHGFSLMSPTYDLHDNGDFWYYVDVLTNHVKRVKVKVWSGSARIYPNDDIPDTYEFARIVHAIEDAFDAELVHAPEDRDV